MNAFKDVETFVFFIGYPRSGHSLVGAMLDAHPNAIISHELDALALLKNGISKLELFDAIYEKSKSFYNSGSKWSGYSYHIPNMWQGRYDTLTVIGDKRGGTSVKHLENNPELIEKAQLLANKCKIIHVYRNPFDCIATAVTKREKAQNIKFNSDQLIRKANHFFKKANVISELAEHNHNIINIRHEDLIKNSRNILTSLCNELDLPIIQDYIDACCLKVWDNPQKSRHKIELWNQQTIDYVDEQINKVPFLKGYNFYE